MSLSLCYHGYGLNSFEACQIRILGFIIKSSFIVCFTLLVERESSMASQGIGVPRVGTCLFVWKVCEFWAINSLDSPFPGNLLKPPLFKIFQKITPPIIMCQVQVLYKVCFKIQLSMPKNNSILKEGLNNTKLIIKVTGSAAKSSIICNLNLSFSNWRSQSFYVLMLVKPYFLS